ncbi:RNA methyltransferase-like protein 1 homolog [Tribolium castaneum]|uniref:RNA methyltransferase-like protein 1 homolog n=2 Tax=Tribolium castaneum TaxID=7070 RepID=D6X2Y6_TRICA|nr:RNA methyltransferase-like protein 1 homolog [Tribolium castaneum]
MSIVKNALKSQIVVSQVKFYSRWSHRRPLKVYSPEEYEEMEKKAQDGNDESSIFDKYGGLKTSWERAKIEKDTNKPVDYQIKSKKDKKPLVATKQKSEVKSTFDMLETVIDNEGNFIYTKMKDNDRRISSILVDVKSKKEQDKKDLILLEGKRLIRDALQSGCALKYILFSRKDEIEYLKPFLPKVGAQLYKMPYKEMQMWSDLTTNPGIMGLFKTPPVEAFEPVNPLPITVICDNIREPGNLGTILRICAAVGCARVILTKGCVNLWDTKVLRGAVGAHFKLKIEKKEWDEIGDEVDPDAKFFIADNRIVSSEDTGGDLGELLGKIPIVPYFGVDFRTSNHLVVVVGGETLGVSKNSYELALRSNGARLNIPLSNDVDSLNVGAALGIIAFEIKKQLLQINQ